MPELRSRPAAAAATSPSTKTSSNGNGTPSSSRKPKGTRSSTTLSAVGFGFVLVLIALLGGMFWVMTNKGPTTPSKSGGGKTGEALSPLKLVRGDDDDDDEAGKDDDDDDYDPITDTDNVKPHSSPKEYAADAKNLKDELGNTLYVVFSTDCSMFQHWQSYLVYYSALRSKQPGRIIRIASGCSDEDEVWVREWFQQHVRPMSSRFELHLTPHFSSVKSNGGKTVGDYKFFNKPFGLRHWLENDVHIGFDKTTSTVGDEHAVVILIDPDMLLLKPITSNFADRTEHVISRHKDMQLSDDERRVRKGLPFGQVYGLGAQWRTFNLTAITSSTDSPAMSVSDADGTRFFPAGPPYLATASDFYNIAKYWTQFAPPLHAQYPYLLAEMFAYCVAAAHLELPHQLVDSLMVSNVHAGGEGWDFVDKFTMDDVCEEAANPPSWTDRSSPYKFPSVVHFCQRYVVGDKFFFGKRRMPQDYFQCESPLMKVPPMDLAASQGSFVVPPEPHSERKELKEFEGKRNAFVYCAITSALRNAGHYFKTHSCGGVEKTNWEESLFLADLF